MTTTAYPEYTQTKTFDSGVEVLASSKRSDATRMTVDSEGAAHIMSLLTDLYSNPNLAVLREYTSNAIDANVEAGQTRPVEISLPSYLSPRFMVQDFGIGMSTETIRDIYSSYGKSTKRQNFNQVGAFGLGCKSALTLTQQFSLVSIRDGKKTVASIARGDDGVGTVNVISVTDTDEGNGTTITIPIKDIYAFNDGASNFFTAMTSGTVLVDGKEPKNRDNLGFRSLTQEGAFYRPTERYSGETGAYVAMGGIFYPVDTSQLDKDIWEGSPFNHYIYDHQVIVDIPIASVDLTPSREAVRYTTRTVKFLSALFKSVFSTILSDIIEEVDSCPTRNEALAKVLEHTENFKNSKAAISKGMFTWNGSPILFSLDGVTLTVIELDKRSVYSNDMATQVHSMTGVKIPTKRQAFYLEASALEIPRLRKNFKAFLSGIPRPLAQDGTMERLKPTDLHIFNPGELPTEPWYVDNSLVTFTTYDDLLDGAKAYRASTRKPKATVTGPKVPAVEISYPTLTVSNDSECKGFVSETLQISDADPTKTYVIYSKDDGKALYDYQTRHPWGNRNAGQTIEKIIVSLRLKDVVLVELSTNRKHSSLVTRFAKKGITPVSFDTWFEGVFSDYLKGSGFTYSDYAESTTSKTYGDEVNDRYVSYFKTLVGNRSSLLDPQLAEFIAYATSDYNTDASDSIHIDNVRDMARTMGDVSTVFNAYFKGLPKVAPVSQKHIMPFLKKYYPLVHLLLDNRHYYAVDSKVQKDLEKYLNTTYNERKSK